MNRTVRLCGLAAVTAAWICAQEYRGAITGIVTDASNASIPKARVQVTNVATSATFNAESAIGAAIGRSYDARDPAGGRKVFITMMNAVHARLICSCRRGGGGSHV